MSNEGVRVTLIVSVKAISQKLLTFSSSYIQLMEGLYFEPEVCISFSLFCCYVAASEGDATLAAILLQFKWVDKSFLVALAYFVIR